VGGTGLARFLKKKIYPQKNKNSKIFSSKPVGPDLDKPEPSHLFLCSLFDVVFTFPSRLPAAFNSTLSNSTHFTTENKPWGQTRARARHVGVRGSLARIKARTHNGAVAASLFPPQKIKAATSPCKHKV